MINENMYKEAVSLGICDKWADKLKNEKPNKMALMYFLGSDWSFKNDFPSLKLLHEYSELEKYNLIFSEGLKEFKNEDHLAFFGKAKGKVIYNAFNVGELYVRHDAEVEIHVSNYAKIFVYLEDNAVLKITADNTSKVSILRYSEKSKVEGNGFKIKDVNHE